MMMAMADDARRPEDAETLTQAGVARIYTPKDFELTQIIADIIALAEGGAKEAA